MNRVKSAALVTAVILSAQISVAQEAEPENLTAAAPKERP